MILHRLSVEEYESHEDISHPVIFHRCEVSEDGRHIIVPPVNLVKQK